MSPSIRAACDMKLGLIAVVSLCVALSGAARLAAASQDCTEDAMVVFDGSGSMSEIGFNQLDEPRIFEARLAMRRSMPRIAPFRRLGLIIYGPGGEESCANVDLRFAPSRTRPIGSSPKSTP